MLSMISDTSRARQTRKQENFSPDTENIFDNHFKEDNIINIHIERYVDMYLMFVIYILQTYICDVIM